MSVHNVQLTIASVLLFAVVALRCMAADPMAPINPGAFNGSVRVACIGDSITEGVGAGVVAATSWPAQLQGLLGAAWQVGNFGVSGRTLLKKGDLPYWDDKAYQHALAFKPDVVIIMLGTNDSKPQNWKHEAEFVSDYRELVKSFQALASKTRIYLCRPCPVPGAGNYGINEAGVKQEIVRIDALAAEMKLGVIDMHAVLVDKPQLLPDNVHPNIDGHREMAKAAFVVLTGLSAEPRNLVPTEPGTSPNYWCTWSVQSYMQGQGAKTNDPVLYQVASIDKFAALQLNEKTLFGTNGWVRNFFPKIRGDLWVVLDDGWDLPVNRDLGYRNYSKLDPEKFPTFKGSIPENLVTLNQRVKACGWRGVGLWYRAYEPAVDAERKKTFKSEAEYKKVFWRERLEWSKAAGIGYWKMDGGGDEAAWKMMTDFSDQFFPGLVMEHGNPSKDGPFNSYPGSGQVYPAYVEAGKRVIQYSEVLRLHDHSPQLGIPTMLGRLASILDAVKTKPAKTGYLNCEDEVFIAAVLGGAMGVMRSPMVGLRPGDDPDIFLKGPRNLKKRMDEVVRAVRWHRLAPAFGAGVTETQVDTKMLVDSYKFPTGEFWTSTEDWAKTYASPYACMNKVVAQGAPARVTRGLPLPEVTCAGEPPFVLASRNPNGAVSIGTLGRLNPERGFYFPEADVSLKIGHITGNIGIFGYYKSLTLVLDKPLGEFRIWAQDLAGDGAVDITSKVIVEGNKLVFPGELIKSIGLSAATPGDLSDPALVVEIVSVCVSSVARGAILERLKNGENLTFAAIGTSLTATDWGFWFQPMGDWLNGQGFPGKVTLANRAVCGSASKLVPGTADYRDGVSQLADVLAKDNPDAVFIEFGINDAYLQYKISKQASRDNLQALIDQIRAWAAKQNQGKGKNVEIIVQAMNNCVKGHADQRPELAHYYQGYREVAQANKGVLFIDTYRKWLDLFNSQPDHATWNRYVPDGIHPNGEGAKGVIVPSVQQALQGQVTKKVFDEACTRAPAEFWAADGVHPTYSGHQLMADEWVKTVSQFQK